MRVEAPYRGKARYKKIQSAVYSSRIMETEPTTKRLHSLVTAFASDKKLIDRDRFGCLKIKSFETIDESGNRNDGDNNKNAPPKEIKILITLIEVRRLKRSNVSVWKVSRSGSPLTSLEGSSILGRIGVFLMDKLAEEKAATKRKFSQGIPVHRTHLLFQTLRAFPIEEAIKPWGDSQILFKWTSSMPFHVFGKRMTKVRNTEDDHFLTVAGN